MTVTSFMDKVFDIQTIILINVKELGINFELRNNFFKFVSTKKVTTNAKKSTSVSLA